MCSLIVFTEILNSWERVRLLEVLNARVHPALVSFPHHNLPQPLSSETTLTRQFMSSPDLVENGTSQTQTHRNGDPRPRTLFSRLVLTFRATWDLWIFSFGGPPVHYQIFYRRFVQTDDEKMKWADDKMVSTMYTLIS